MNVDLRPADWFPLRLHDDADHHAALARKRAHAPVELQAPFGADGPQLWVVYRYDDVAAVLDDEETYDTEVVDERYGAVLGESFVTTAPAARRAARRALIDALPSTDDMERLVRGVVAEVLDPLAAGDDVVDLVPLLALVPARVLARLLGLPEADGPDVGQAAAALAQFLADPRRGVRAAASLRRRFRAALASGPNDRPGLLHALATAEIDGRSLDDDEVVASMLLLAWAGTETAVPGIATALFAVLSHPLERASIDHDPGRVPRAVEEAVRWEAPVQITARRVRRHTELAGRRLTSGATVLAHLGSANRDDRHFSRAEVFDPDRPVGERSLTFGHGPHRCFGRHLARTEMAVVVREVLERYPSIRLATSSPPPEGHVVRSPRRLLVELR